MGKVDRQGDRGEPVGRTELHDGQRGGQELEASEEFPITNQPPLLSTTGLMIHLSIPPKNRPSRTFDVEDLDEASE